MMPIARTLDVSRTSLYATPKERGEQERVGDAELLKAIETVIEHKATFGYRRVTARLKSARFVIRAHYNRVVEDEWGERVKLEDEIAHESERSEHNVNRQIEERIMVAALLICVTKYW